MLFCLPFYSGDIPDTKRLLSWISDLGGCAGHDCLLIADQDVDWQDALKCKELAELSFKSVKIIYDGEHAPGWIPACNSKWKSAALYALENNCAFYFNEPDATPLKHGFLDTIEAEYKTCGKPFSGPVVSHETPNFPNPYLEANAVFPANAWEIVKADWQPLVVRESAYAHTVLPLAHNSKLFQHIWGEFNNPPVFAEKNVPGTNVFCLKQIKPEAVVFHRCKGGSLIRLLQKQRGISKPIVVVFPVCQNDIHLALHHAKWLRSMNRKWGHKALITFDSTINLIQLTEFRNFLAQCFNEVELFKYPIPPVLSWPHAPNWAWQRTAEHMTFQDHAWFWNEADAVWLTSDCLDVIDDEYQGCGKSWMGSLVKDSGHMNGCAVYPSDAALRMPIAMKCTGGAWDYLCKPEIQHDLNDANHIMQHLWRVEGETIFEGGSGQAPTGITLDRANRWLRKGAVFTHRVKDLSLVNLLMSGQWKP